MKFWETLNSPNIEHWTATEKNTSVNHLINCEPTISLTKYSNWRNLLRVTAYILRFSRNIQARKQHCQVQLQVLERGYRYLDLPLRQAERIRLLPPKKIRTTNFRHSLIFIGSCPCARVLLDASSLIRMQPVIFCCRRSIQLWRLSYNSSTYGALPHPRNNGPRDAS